MITCPTSNQKVYMRYLYVDPCAASVVLRAASLILFCVTLTCVERRD